MLLFPRACSTAFLLILGLLTSVAVAADSPEIPKPTKADVSYGDRSRHRLHFWQAESDQPAPVAVFIHGGGWNGGKRINRDLVRALPPLLEAGVSVVSVEYRLIRHGVSDGVFPPVLAPLSDCARAVQFVRSKAEDWNLDPQRLGLFGGSAGACTSLWLAFHDDLADPQSEDPVQRLSTRPTCAAAMRAQTTLDPVQMKEWMPNGFYGGHAFGIIKRGDNRREEGIREFLARRDELLPLINEYSPYSLASSDDPPVYLYYTTKPALGKNTKDPTHSSNYGVKLHEHLQELGVESELVYPGARGVVHKSVVQYLIDRLATPKAAAL